jgi:hypothetical protein
MKKVFLSLLAIGALAFGFAFSSAGSQTTVAFEDATVQNLPIQPPV